MLSAQTKDAVTHAASTRLFRVARTPRTMARLPVKEIERLIYPVSFYRNKAVHVQHTCEQILSRYGGVVPDTMEDLLTLPGVGRKTANLVLILAHRSRGQHLRRYARASHLQSSRLGENADAGGDRACAVRRDASKVVAGDQSLSGDLGPERLPARVSAVRQLRSFRPLSENRRHTRGTKPARREDCLMTIRATLTFCLAFLALGFVPRDQTSPGAGPVIVLETAKGNIEFETYPEEAPKTVAQIVGLVKKNFYNGLRFHRVEAGIVQIGDPQTRNMLMKDYWGREASGKPIGAAEITKKRRHIRGAVAMAYPGTDARSADSQFFIDIKPHPEWDGKYTVFGKVIKGIEVADKIQVADVVKKAYVKEGPAIP